MAFLVAAAAAIAGVLSAVRRAARLPPAEAMRPEPPANYRPALVERTGIARFLSHTFRIAVRNLERRPAQALFTITGLALATGILIVPNAFRDGVSAILDFQWDVVQRQDLSVGLLEPGSVQVCHLFRQLPGVLVVEPVRAAAVRLSFGHQRRQLGILGLPSRGLHNRVIDDQFHDLPLPPAGLIVSTKLADILGARPGDDLLVEALEGKRTIRNVRLAGLAEDFSAIMGGHTIIGSESMAGLAVFGQQGQSFLAKGETNAGEHLFLSKPLGVGLVARGFRNALAGEDSMEEALEVMLISNRDASRVASAARVSSATDISGFGLLGHLVELLRAGHGAIISVEQVPILAAASALPPHLGDTYWTRGNLDYVTGRRTLVGKTDQQTLLPLLDPQTNGGLLVSAVADTVPVLEDHGFVRIGVVTGLEEIRLV